MLTSHVVILTLEPWFGSADCRLGIEYNPLLPFCTNLIDGNVGDVHDLYIRNRCRQRVRELVGDVELYLPVNRSWKPRWSQLSSEPGIPYLPDQRAQEKPPATGVSTYQSTSTQCGQSRLKPCVLGLASDSDEGLSLRRLHTNFALRGREGG